MFLALPESHVGPHGWVDQDVRSLQTLIQEHPIQLGRPKDVKEGMVCVIFPKKNHPKSWWRPPIFPNSPQKHGWWWPPCSWRGSQHSSSPEDPELPHQLCSPPPQLTCSTWRSPAKDFRTGVQIFIHLFQDFWRFAHLSPHAAIDNGLGEIFNNDDLWQICWQRAHEVPHAC